MSEQEIEKRCGELERRIAIEAEPDIEVARQKARAMIKGKAPGIPESAPNGAINGLLSPWRRYLWTIDQQANLAKVKCAILALNGEKDLQAPPKQNLAAMEKALKTSGNKNYTLKELSGLNHMLQTADTGAESEYWSIEETIAPVALETIAEWIKEQTK